MTLLQSIFGLGGSVSFLSVVGSLFGFVLVYVLSSAAYNIFLHPLRKVPGPLLWRASYLPWFFSCLNGTIHSDTQKLHDKYGTSVRIAPNYLSFTHANSRSDIYAHRVGALAKVPETRKADYLNAPFAYLGQHVDILHAEGEEHRMLRRALAHPFSEKGLMEQAPLIEGYVDLMMRQLRKVCQAGEKGSQTTTVDMVAWIRLTTHDIISDLSMGQPLKMLENMELHRFAGIGAGSTKFAVVVSAIDLIGLSPLLRPIIGPKMRKAFEAKNTEIGIMVKAREAAGPRSDLIDGLISKRDELGFSDNILAANAITLVGAGSDTTAAGLYGVIYCILANPAVHARLQKEVRATFSYSSEITLATVGQLHYLLSCILESLRIYPPSMTGNCRETTGPMTIDGYAVPAGTLVEAMNWAINHEPANWTDPWTYKPERFIIREDDDGNVLETYQPFLKAEAKAQTNANGDRVETLQPFSAGPRNCLGRSLAYAEMRMIVARLFFDFDVEFAPGFDKEAWFDQKAYFVWDVAPLPVQLTPRAI